MRPAKSCSDRESLSSLLTISVPALPAVAAGHIGHVHPIEDIDHGSIALFRHFELHQHRGPLSDLSTTASTAKKVATATWWTLGRHEVSSMNRNFTPPKMIVVVSVVVGGERIASVLCSFKLLNWIFVVGLVVGLVGIEPTTEGL